jgi:hypothetical protein
MFSYKHYGSLPGLDIAFLLDGAAYHTDRDTVDRLRPGTLQVRHHMCMFGDEQMSHGAQPVRQYLGLQSALSNAC